MNSKDLINAIGHTDESSFEAGLETCKTLECATIKDARVGAMRIHTVDASNTEWEACIFDGTCFDGIDLQCAFFNGCTFHECTFKNVILAETSFDGCVWHSSKILSPEDLEATEITNCQFKECVFEGLEFLDSTLHSLTITSGCIRDCKGIADLKSIVLRSVDISNFDTSEMTVSGCSASGCTTLPEGFSACEGKRRRV